MHRTSPRITRWGRISCRSAGGSPACRFRRRAACTTSRGRNYPPPRGAVTMIAVNARASFERLPIMDIGAIGKFQILGTLGTGAHSTILHVRRSTDSKQYALKVVPLETAE